MKQKQYSSCFLTSSRFHRASIYLTNKPLQSPLQYSTSFTPPNVIAEVSRIDIQNSPHQILYSFRCTMHNTNQPQLNPLIKESITGPIHFFSCRERQAFDSPYVSFTRHSPSLAWIKNNSWGMQTFRQLNNSLIIMKLPIRLDWIVGNGYKGLYSEPQQIFC